MSAKYGIILLLSIVMIWGENQIGLAHESPRNHHHKPMEIPAGEPIPTVSLGVHPDAVRGWNLEVKVSNFRFAPEQASREARPGEGHAHLFINGEKITRIYGNWYYLGTLPPGRHEIRVSLSSNDHQDLVYQGQLIEALEIIEVSAASN